MEGALQLPCSRVNLQRTLRQCFGTDIAGIARTCMDAPESNERFIVLAALDGSAMTEGVVRASANFAQMRREGELHLVHVVEDMRPMCDDRGRRPTLTAPRTRLRNSPAPSSSRGRQPLEKPSWGPLPPM